MLRQELNLEDDDRIISFAAKYNKPMPNNDIEKRADMERIVRNFYHQVLNDPIIGFIFTDVAEIKLESHIPVIVDFWMDIVFGGKRYGGNAMKKHLQLHAKIALREGHFTRWLYLFERAVTEHNHGPRCDLMIARAKMIADSISAAVNKRDRGSVQLSLSDRLA